MAVESMIRRRVAPDNSCLFSAVGYLCQGKQGSSLVRELRAAVAEHVKQDPEAGEASLGMDKEAYCEWIQKFSSWGGENEIVFLSAFFDVEIQVLLMQASSSALTYGQGERSKGRIYLLYTGQHYDPVVGGVTPDDMTEDETKVFRVTDAAATTAIDALAITLANVEFIEHQRRASIQVKKMLKCLGCGATLPDSAAFQEHCGEVEHDDDFGYECQEVEVEVEMPGGGGVPNLFTFYNTATSPLSPLYPAEFEVDGDKYASLEHFFQASRFVSSNPTLAAKIKAASDGAEAARLGEYGDDERGDWDAAKQDVLLQGVRSMIGGVAACRDALLATEDKDIGMVGGDLWSGISVQGDEVRGKNILGKLLAQVRAELRAA